MVREAKKEDLQELLRLYLSLHETETPENSQHLSEVWDNIISDKNYHIIVNAIDGKIVSSCTCVIIPNLTRSVRPYSLIENVVTNAAYHQKGYATACLAYARDISKKENCYKMMLLTGSKEAKILAFYRSAGYDDSAKTAFVQRID